MIVKGGGRDQREGDNLGIHYLCQFATAMVEPFQQGVDQDKGGYDPLGVHRFLLHSDYGLATIILPQESMGLN
jgi:hypothetical protein